MRSRPWAGLCAEDAAPVATVDVVAGNLRDRFGARYVSFLFVDVVGWQVVRVGEEAATQQDRRAEQIPLAGNVYYQVLRTQKLALLKAEARRAGWEVTCLPGSRTCPITRKAGGL
jgi:hypothetical protein